jgi:hypothetical protein
MKEKLQEYALIAEIISALALAVVGALSLSAWKSIKVLSRAH